MSACVRCGFDPDAVPKHIATYVVRRKPMSLNQRISNTGVTRFIYAKMRNEWGWELRAARLTNLIPKAERRRIVTLTRFYSGHEREWDADNWIGGAKVIVDAMVLEGLITDDSSAGATIHYAQQRAEFSGVLFKFEEPTT